MDLSKYYLKNTHEIDYFFKMNKERFTIFFNAVYKMLDELKPGERFRIPDVCEERSYEVFIKVTGFYIYEEGKRTIPDEPHIEFSDDYCTVMRSRDFSRKPLYSDIQKKRKKE